MRHYRTSNFITRNVVFVGSYASLSLLYSGFISLSIDTYERCRWRISNRAKDISCENNPRTPPKTELDRNLVALHVANISICLSRIYQSKIKMNEWKERERGGGRVFQNSFLFLINKWINKCSRIIKLLNAWWRQ